MAANVVGLSETNGTSGSPVTTDTISNINFGSVDSPNLVANSHKIIIGLQSYAKWIRFQLITNNNTSDSAIVVYKSAGSYVTGENIATNMGLNYGAGSYITTYGHIPVPSGGTALSPMPYSGLSPSGISGTNFATSAGSENLIIGTSTGNTLTSNGSYSSYAYFQLFSSGSTPAGSVNTKTITFQYNEV
jgi:hypothetical protein